MLTDLEQTSHRYTEPDIVPDNISAVGTIYFAWQAEGLRLFEVADRLAELATRRQLPLDSGPAAAMLTNYEFNPDRLSTLERQHLYARTFGAPGGAAVEGEVNLEFNDLWLRFISSVAEFARQPGVPGSPRPALLAQPSVRNAATALAANLSLHGSESASVAAKQLHRTIEQLLQLLQAPEVSKALGVSNMWDVIDRINRQHLGGAVDIARARMLAKAGMHIMTWLAAHVADLHGAAGRAAPDAKTRLPDADLISTVEQWLTAHGGSAGVVGQSAHPSEPPPATLPIVQLPTLAAEALEALNRVEADARSRPGGVCALFHGAESTDRTLAAQMLATRLARNLYRVDLAAAVLQDKGETAKALDRAFAKARETGAVLLFDEADALFGKRAEVKDAPDRYTNPITSQLLQQIDAYGGLVLLATDSKPALDGALLRRLRHLIDFPPRAQRKSA
jgi:hypothetical protein